MENYLALSFVAGLISLLVFIYMLRLLGAINRQLKAQTAVLIELARIQNGMKDLPMEISHKDGSDKKSTILPEYIRYVAEVGDGYVPERLAKK